MQGNNDLCIAPSESVISCWTSDAGRIKPIAIAALLQNDGSAIVTKASSGITDPSMLDGHTYASYDGRFEMNIVRQMIKNAGGKGEVIETIPKKLDCFDALLRGDVDSTWIFLAWEGFCSFLDLQHFHRYPFAAL